MRVGERETLLGSSTEPGRARPPSLLGMGISTRGQKGPGRGSLEAEEVDGEVEPLCLTLTLSFARYREESPQVPCADRLHPYFVKKETQWQEGKYDMQLETVATYEIPYEHGEGRSLELRMKFLGKSLE